MQKRIQKTNGNTGCCITSPSLDPEREQPLLWLIKRVLLLRSMEQIRVTLQESLPWGPWHRHENIQSSSPGKNTIKNSWQQPQKDKSKQALRLQIAREQDFYKSQTATPELQIYIRNVLYYLSEVRMPSQSASDDKAGTLQFNLQIHPIWELSSCTLTKSYAK